MDQTLRISGEVDAPREWTLQQLQEVPEEFQIADAAAVDSCRQGRAVWLTGILQSARPTANARYVTLHASSDDFHASIPLDEVRERGYVIYQLDDAALPASSGGPFRFAIRDFAACQSHEIDECANVKFVDWIELSARPGRDNRPHDDDEHAKLHNPPN